VWTGIQLDVFGFSSSQELFQHRLFNILVQGSLHPETGRDQVTVLMLSDEALERISDKLRGEGLTVSWPLPAWVHAGILEGLADLAKPPRAVFLDWMFLDERAGDDVGELVDAFVHLNAVGTRVYLVDAGDDGVPSVRADLLREIAARKAVVRFVPVPFQTTAGAMLSYEGRVRDAEGRTRLTAAFGIYEDLHGPVADPTPVLQIVYGTLTNPTNDLWMRRDPGVPACATDRSLPLRLWDALGGLDSLRRDCPYLDEVPADQLLGGLWPPFVEKLGSDRVVLYGGNLQGVADFYETPTHGRGPGVRINAAALDNLLSYGAQGYKRADLRVGPWLVPPWLRNLAIVFSFVALLTLLRRCRERRRSEDPERALASRLAAFADYLMVVVPFLILAVGLYAWFDLAVGSWIGLAQVVGWSALARETAIVESMYGYFSEATFLLHHSRETRGES
jgi:CHASE2 domain-containing sensor protein